MRKQVAIIGGGFTGLWAASAMSSRDMDLDIIEWGTKDTPPGSLYVRPWASSSMFFSGEYGGIRLQLGGRSNCWTGLAMRMSDRAVESSVHVDLQDLEKFSARQDSVASVMNVDIEREMLDSWAIGESLRSKSRPVPRSIPTYRIPIEAFAHNKDNISVSKSTRVQSISINRADIEVATSKWTREYDTVILACGVVESFRLLAGAALQRTREPSLTVGGLGDHAVVGIAITVDANLVPLIGGLDHFVPSIDDQHYMLIQTRPSVSGASVIVEAWGFVEVGGTAEQSLTLTADDIPMVSIDFELSEIDNENLLGLAQNLATIAHDLSGELNLPTEGISNCGTLRTLPSYQDICDKLEPTEWSWHFGKPGSVHHELSGRATQELLDRLGCASSGRIWVLGGAGFGRIGAYNPTLGFLAAAEMVADLV